jgi:hypothetical protein
MERDGKSKPLYERITFRKFTIILISAISILSIMVLCINYLHFSTFSTDFI